MAGAEQIRLQQFDVAALVAPPALLCQQLLQSTEARDGNPPPASQALLQNPALLLRVLDACYRLYPDQATASLDQRLTLTAPESLHSHLTDMALQLVLSGSKCDHLFQQLHWQDSCRSISFARALAEYCGEPDPLHIELSAALLDCGKLVLEQQHGRPWTGLYLEIEQQQRLLQAERQTLGIDHIQAGVALLESWQLEQDCIDALRYQAEPLEAVLDATPLVRIAWLARVLAGLRPELEVSVEQAAARLFGLTAQQLTTLRDRALADYRNRLRGWDAAGLYAQERRGSDLTRQNFERELREELQRLQWQLLSERTLQALEAREVGAATELGAVLASALQQAQVEPRFVVLASGPDGRQLQHVADHKLGPVPALGLQLEPGRSALADLVLAGELARLQPDQPGLRVIDRQLLQLLGGSLFCEPVQTSSGRVVLLLAAHASYPQRRLLRAFVRRKLAEYQRAAAGFAAAPDDTALLLYRQRVREAVHEANNPLAIIKNYLQILHMKLGEAGAAREIRIISGEIDRVATILGRLRDTDAGPAPARSVDLNALLRSLHPVLAQGFGLQQDRELRLDLAPDPLQVHASPDVLKQILMNLVKNAAEACGTGAVITVATRRNVYQNGALYLQLSVADNGPGMPAEQIADPFVPGRSSKGGAHRGTGLAIVKRLVDDMQGQLGCQSDSKGTLISILLPQLP